MYIRIVVPIVTTDQYLCTTRTYVYTVLKVNPVIVKNYTVYVACFSKRVWRYDIELLRGFRNHKNSYRPCDSY